MRAGNFILERRFFMSKAGPHPVGLFSKPNHPLPEGEGQRTEPQVVLFSVSRRVSAPITANPANLRCRTRPCPVFTGALPCPALAAICGQLDTVCLAVSVDSDSIRGKQACHVPVQLHSKAIP